MNRKVTLPYVKGKFHRLFGRWRGRVFFVFRRIAAVGLFITAVIISLNGPTDASAKNSHNAALAQPTVTLAHDLFAGVPLTRSDLRVVMMPANFRPVKAFSSAEEILGQILLSPARSGETLTDQRLSSTVTGLPPPGKPAAGNSALSIVPVRLSDPGISELLRPGAKVDVISTDSTHQESHTLASNVTVVTVLAHTAASTASTASPTQETARANPLVLISVPADISASIAAATLEKPVTVTLR